VKILSVKANKLLPVQSGGDIRSYHVARYLASRHELTFLSYYGGEADPRYEAELARELPGAVSIATGRYPQGALQRGIDYLWHLPLRASYAVSRFASPRVRATLAAWYRERRFDVSVCDFLDAAVNLPADLSIPTVLFQHNVETEIWRRHVLTEPSQVKKLFYGVEFMKMLAYERRAVARFSHIIAVSEHDRSLMAAWTPASRITVVPTGVDLAQYQRLAGSEQAQLLASARFCDVLEGVAREAPAAVVSTLRSEREAEA
jgi:Glycosyltransferase Family 4